MFAPAALLQDVSARTAEQLVGLTAWQSLRAHVTQFTTGVSPPKTSDCSIISLHTAGNCRS